MQTDYADYRRQLLGRLGQLRKAAGPVMAGFAQLHKAVAAADGALSLRHKELMALALAVGMRCEGCIAVHVHDAIKAGATREEIVEAIGVAILMGGGPAMMYGAEALKAADDFLGGEAEANS